MIRSPEGLLMILAKRAALAVCLLLSTSLFAQFETSEVLGTVHDPSGAPVPNASVILTNQDTNVGMKTTTNSDGNYDFFNVKVGRYTVAVEASGFSKATATDVTIAVGTRQRVD